VSEPVTWETSQMATDLIVGQARVFGVLPLAELLDFYSKAESIGPMLDPTGYMKHGRGIAVAERIVRAASAFLKEIKAAVAEAPKA
jgi:hypothetical protein